jgi:hypothetical protein
MDKGLLLSVVNQERNYLRMIGWFQPNHSTQDFLWGLDMMMFFDN